MGAAPLRCRTSPLILAAVAQVALAALPAGAQQPGDPETRRVIEAPPDSAHWDFAGGAAVSEYLGRTSLVVNGGSAVLRDFTMRDAVIDFDVATPATRGFFGVEFRAGDTESEYIYLRQHKSGLPDAMQYTPVLGTGLNWQLFSGPGFIGRVDIPRDRWFHIRLAVAGAQARLWVEDMETPALVIDDLKTGLRSGQLAFSVLIGETHFTNVVVHETAEAPWERHLPAMPEGTLTHWRISPAYDALARSPEWLPPPADLDTIPWRDVEAEPPGLVALYRYLPAPHPRVTFQSDFATRLDPQPGTQMVYARTTIESHRAQVKKLALGYSDEVTVFLNGKILFRGRSAQSFRDPGFLGIVDPENDAVYLPLEAGRNDLVLALSELGGGWGFICRLEDPGI